MKKATQRLSTVLVEDDDLTRARLARELASSASVEIVASCATFGEGKRALDQHAPSILVTDLGLPDGSGIDLIKRARARATDCHIMVITVFGDERNVVSALEAGADSYLLKDATGSEMSSAVDELVAGGSPISPPIARHLLQRFRTPPPDAAANLDEKPEKVDHGSLSAREFEVLNLVSKGFSFPEIAELLGVSPHTIRTHVRRMYQKLEVSSKSAAVYEAVNLGLIDLG